MKSIEQISNDFSENMPVSKSDLIRLVKYTREENQKLINKINNLRDLMVDAMIKVVKTELQ
jgi:hypothetical protein